MKEILIEKLGLGWYNQLKPFLESEEFTKLNEFIRRRRSAVAVYPESDNVLKAFKMTPFEEVRVVLLGMDPYPNPNEAIGLSFGINWQKVRTIPPSLRNIHQELEKDLNVLALDFDYSLEHWAKQGVLLLNTALTVEHKSPSSHISQWAPFNTQVFKALNNLNGIIYILLGREAQKFESMINAKSNYIIKAPHPAAESYQGGNAGFFGSKIFSRTNEFIKGQNGADYTINWSGLSEVEVSDDGLYDPF